MEREERRRLSFTGTRATGMAGAQPTQSAAALRPLRSLSPTTLSWTCEVCQVEPKDDGSTRRALLMLQRQGNKNNSASHEALNLSDFAHHRDNCAEPCRA